MPRMVRTASNEIERQLVSDGFSPVIGCDEVGRGPIAGPVVAAAVILPHDCMIEGVYDSKKVSEKKRVLLAESIKKEAIAIAYGVVRTKDIDEINILQATMLAMKNAIDDCYTQWQNTNHMILNDVVSCDVSGITKNIPKPIALIDGNQKPALTMESQTVVQGDQKSYLIAAASILAKVFRDDAMMQIHKRYPMYGFDSNKGYGTKTHIDAIRQHGLCPFHRITFCKNFI